METTSLEKREPEVLDRQKSSEGACVLVPRTDVYETPDALVMLADMPGAQERTIDVRVDKDVLFIEGHVPAESQDGFDLLHGEHGPARFRREFSLPGEVDQERISAELKDGVLKVTLAKTEAAKPRKIEVKA